MAKYKKVEVYLKGAKNKLNRTIYVKADLNLSDVGLAIVGSFGAWFEHCWYFTANKKDYIPLWFEEWLGANWDFYEKYNFDELGDRFEIEYDTGEGYVFVCNVKETVTIPNKRKMMIIESAKGYCIFENDRLSLDLLLNKEINDENYLDNEDFSLPMNMSMENPSDFYKPIDIETYQEIVDLNILITRKNLEEEYKRRDVE